MKRLKIKHLATLTAALLFSVLSISCGGGGGTLNGGGDGGGDGGDGGGGNLTAVFVGDTAGDVSMSAGSSSGEDFEIQVSVSGIDNFSGAAFHIFFDSSSAAFLAPDGTDSILGDIGEFDAALVTPGEVAVSAVRRGQAAGIADATGLLVRLHFYATAGTSENRFTFGSDNPVDESRRVKICPIAGGECSDFVPASWTGGTLMVTE